MLTHLIPTDNLLNELMDKANLGYEERNRYKKELEEKDAEIERLKIHKSEAEYEARQLRYQMNQLNDINVNVEIPSVHSKDYPYHIFYLQSLRWFHYLFCLDVKLYH